MPISYKDIRTHRQWKASTGLSEEDFKELVKLFAAVHEEFHEVTLSEQIAERIDDPKIEFTEKQKLHNKEVSSKRIYVEHAIGGLKRYRFLSDGLRCRNAKFYSTVLGVYAGIWNFQLSR